MKKALLSLLIIAAAGFSANAQLHSRPAPLVEDVQMTLAGVSGQPIKASEIPAQPIVSTLQGKEVASFDFSWTRQSATGGVVILGPYHNNGSRLNEIILADFAKAVASGDVTKVYIAGVYLKNADGSSTKTNWGAAYAVKP